MDKYGQRVESESKLTVSAVDESQDGHKLLAGFARYAGLAWDFVTASISQVVHTIARPLSHPCKHSQGSDASRGGRVQQFTSAAVPRCPNGPEARGAYLPWKLSRE